MSTYVIWHTIYDKILDTVSYYQKYVKKKKQSMGILIYYLSLFLLRFLEIKCLKMRSIPIIWQFMRNFKLVDKGDEPILIFPRTMVLFKKLIVLTNLDALYPTEKNYSRFNCTYFHWLMFHFLDHAGMCLCLFIIIDSCQKKISFVIL